MQDNIYTALLKTFDYLINGEMENVSQAAYDAAVGFLVDYKKILPNWAEIPPKYNWRAIDYYGEEVLFVERPYTGDVCWYSNGAYFNTGKICKVPYGVVWEALCWERPKNG